jgi:hypothetical protein
MSGHTPGPWTMETVRTSCGVCHRIGPFPPPEWSAKREGWACVYDDFPASGRGTPQLVANARLIAAAPDLLAALESIACIDISEVGAWEKVAGRMQATALEAIEKATGGQS